MMRLRRSLLCLVACVTLLSTGSAALAWGREGHEIVVLIARHLLSPDAVAAADALLVDADPRSLALDAKARFARAANWADYWRFSHRETEAWHYVDIEIDAPDLVAACHGFPVPAEPASAGPAQDCIVGRIEAFAAELANPAVAREERVIALKFLLHLVGDLHQPLHAADHADRGGNCLRVVLDGSRSLKLHALWDTDLVEDLGLDASELADELVARVSPEQRRAWTTGDPSAWAMESFAIAKASAYPPGAPAGCDGDMPVTLPDGYETRGTAIVAQQLEKAGVRLAAMLEVALGKGATIGTADARLPNSEGR